MWKASGTVTWTVSTPLWGCSLGARHLSVSLWHRGAQCWLAPSCLLSISETTVSNRSWYWSYIESRALGAGNSAISWHSSRIVWSLCCLSQEVERKNLRLKRLLDPFVFLDSNFPLWNLWFRFQTRRSWRQVQIGQSLIKMPTCLSCENWVRAESCRTGTEHITRPQHPSRAVSFSKEAHTEEPWLPISTPGSKKLVFTLSLDLGSSPQAELTGTFCDKGVRSSCALVESKRQLT